MIVQFSIPGLRLKTGLNLREHHFARATRVQVEKLALFARWREFRLNTMKLELPCVVTIMRIGPRRIDDDNVSGGCKAIRDQIAKELGVDDGDREKIAFVYAQRLGDYGVEVRIHTSARVESVVLENTQNESSTNG